MLNFGIKGNDLKEFHGLLFSSHQLFIRMQMMDLSHNHEKDISDIFLDGQVDYDDEGDVEASASLQFFDPSNIMDIVSNSPNHGAMFADRMIRVLFCVGRVDGTKWFVVPLITGPITKLDRDRNFINCNISGKEYLLYSSGVVATYGSKRQITDVMTDILRDNGEKKFSVKKRSKKLNKKLAVGGTENTPWSAIKSLAGALGDVVAYDGNGAFYHRDKNTKSMFTFDETKMTTEPQFGYNLDNLINRVKVIGAKPKGKKTMRVSSTVTAPKSHPLSPHALGRNGKPRYYTLTIEDEKLKSKKACRNLAKRRLKQGLMEAQEASFETLAVPHLQKGDFVTVKTANFQTKVPCRKRSISLKTPGKMTFGFNKNMKPATAMIRRNKK